jgi:hypothetical protein
MWQHPPKKMILCCFSMICISEKKEFVIDWKGVKGEIDSCIRCQRCNSLKKLDKIYSKVSRIKHGR